MLQEEPLQPLALEPLTEEEQVGLGHWSPILEGLGWEDRWWRVQFWTGWGQSGTWVLTPTPGSLLRETSPCQ